MGQTQKLQLSNFFYVNLMQYLTNFPKTILVLLYSDTMGYCHSPKYLSKSVISNYFVQTFSFTCLSDCLVPALLKYTGIYTSFPWFQLLLKFNKFISNYAQMLRFVFLGHMQFTHFLIYLLMIMWGLLQSNINEHV